MGYLQVILISHRGNIVGPNEMHENDPEYILEAIRQGYEVEIDVWRVSGDWFLGHDKPEYLVKEDFLKNDKFWCHAKNLPALQGLLYLEAKCFWHQTDTYTLTSNGYIWTYPGEQLTNMSICVMPEKSTGKNYKVSDCVGICSDFIKKYRMLI